MHHKILYYQFFNKSALKNCWNIESHNQSLLDVFFTCQSEQVSPSSGLKSKFSWFFFDQIPKKAVHYFNKRTIQSISLTWKWGNYPFHLSGVIHQVLQAFTLTFSCLEEWRNVCCHNFNIIQNKQTFLGRKFSDPAGEAVLCCSTEGRWRRGRGDQWRYDAKAFIFLSVLSLATPTSEIAPVPRLNRFCSIRLLPEFDKFLEERAKAAEMSPPSGEPGAVQGTPKRKKAERPDESLLAM